jgi:hypothetical protein
VKDSLSILIELLSTALRHEWGSTAQIGIAKKTAGHKNDNCSTRVKQLSLFLQQKNIKIQYFPYRDGQYLIDFYLPFMLPNLT